MKVVLHALSFGKAQESEVCKYTAVSLCVCTLSEVLFVPFISLSLSKHNDHRFLRC